MITEDFILSISIAELLLVVKTWAPGPAAFQTVCFIFILTICCISVLRKKMMLTVLHNFSMIELVNDYNTVEPGFWIAAVLLGAFVRFALLDTRGNVILALQGFGFSLRLPSTVSRDYNNEGHSSPRRHIQELRVHFPSHQPIYFFRIDFSFVSTTWNYSQIFAHFIMNTMLLSGLHYLDILACLH